MKDIKYYSRDAIESRFSFRQSVGHKITKYTRHTEYGVVKIYYHIDITSAMAFVSGFTVIPGLLYLGDNAFNDGELCQHEETHYFDAASGQEISYSTAQENKNKNKKADLLNREGNELHEQGKYEEAYEKFKQAYNRCTSGYSNEARFKSNRDVAKNCWSKQLYKQGIELYRQNNYSGAAKKYKDAYNTCTDDRKDLEKLYLCNEAKCYMMQERYSKAIELCDRALHIDSDYEDAKNIQAEILNAWGDSLFNKRCYVEAVEKYNQAYLKCTSGYNCEQLFKNNLRKSQAELDAIGLKEQGDQEFNAGRYDSAKVKYQEAYNKSRLENNKKIYTTCINRTKAELDAVDLIKQGDQEFNAGRYDSAKFKYQEAYEKSRFETKKDICAARINRTKSELDAVSLKEVGDREFKAGRYDSAKIKYQEAYYKSGIEANKKTYTTYINYTKSELDAIGLKEIGDSEFNAGKYDCAKVKYQEAYNKSRIENNQKTYAICINHAKAELDAVGLKELGDQEFNACRYDSAKFKYQEAYEKSRVEANKKIYITCINRTKSELDAIGLKEIGDSEFNAGKYDCAKVKYQEAYNKSRIENNKKTYTICINHAKAELDAVGLKEVGDQEFNACRYDSAKFKYQEAYEKSRVEANKKIYTTCINRTKSELDAIGLKEIGDSEFNAGKYDCAKVKYQEAYNKSRIENNKKTYTICINHAKAELDAVGLKELGDREFSAGRYDSAKCSYQEAYEKSRIEANKKIYITCINRAKAELDAIGLKEMGDREFNAGRYDSAKVKYKEAYDKSRIEANKNTYTVYMNKSQVELDALSAYQHGEILFREGKYSEAVVEYQVACSKSEINEAKNIYLANKNRAQNEVNAIILKVQGDYLLEQGEYEAALNKYQAAYHKSQITKEKSRYAFNKDEAQTIIINRLSVKLDTLWKEAWDTENDDGKSDKSEDAKEKFQNILNETKEGLKIFPDNLKFKQYETLILLKIEGNELFNTGIELQQNGIELLQEAQELKQQQNFQLANEKLKDAKDKFSDAQEKFKEGSENDQRFVSCVEFVEEQMKEVIQSIAIIEEHMQSQLFNNLNIITNNNHLDSDCYDSNMREDQHQYYEQIF